MDYKYENVGVYGLLTELCNKTASKYCGHSRVSQKRLLAKMRSLAYEVILKRSAEDIPVSKSGPISDLLSFYFNLQNNIKNVAEYKRSEDLKRLIQELRNFENYNNKAITHNVLKLIYVLKDTVKEDLTVELFKTPFTFGLLDQMLPRLPREIFGSPEPYQYYPSYVFELPFSIKKQGLNLHAQNPSTEYIVESFDSRSYLPEKSKNSECDIRTFHSPMSLASVTSTHFSPYSQTSALSFPRLTAPRDLIIPGVRTPEPKISIPSTDIKIDTKEVFCASNDVESIDIWEIASQIDKDIPYNIWDIVSKMPPVYERQLIASSSREIALWREMYNDIISELCVVSERQFIRHIMYLTFGVETSSFPFSEESNCFFMKDNICLEGISKECLQSYMTSLLVTGTYYRRLYHFAFKQSLDDNFQSNGLIYESAREVIRRYLLDFRLKATEIFTDCFNSNEEGKLMPTLLQILHHIEPIKYELETIATIYKMTNAEPTSIPCGAELMSYLFNEISLVTHESTACTMFNSLFSICKVYFKFIERFIFEGELDDRYHEFFIRKDNSYINCCSKRYWDKGFHISQTIVVPEFLRVLAKCILLCGKSLRLLKLCNPRDPLVSLISSDHPSVKCCASFEELDRQQQILDVYRTRCLFVSGEPATFEQILLKKEAERKAFTEMALLKQAETMEKIIAERKRFAQLIIAEKQHSLRVLEAAMAEAKAAKSKRKQREKIKCELEQAIEKSREEVDAKLKDEERNNIMEYYSKLNMEVEKSKIHTEWKIRRLQLDQPRIQLLSTEERNLKREKLELEHQRNEENMAMSIQSLETKSDEDGEDNVSPELDEAKDTVNTIPTSKSGDRKVEPNSVSSIIYNVAKSFFGSIKKSNSENEPCDNRQNLDPQGNIITVVPGDYSLTGNTTEKDTVDIGNNLVKYDNTEYYKTRLDALNNREKVMSHDFGQTDIENNTLKVVSPKNYDDNNTDNKIFDIFNPFEEAKRNKMKVEGSKINTIDVVPKIFISEPKTDEQKQAILNRQKVLGIEYNMSQNVVKKEPMNDAQEEALRNRKKILGSDYDNYSLELNPKKQSIRRSSLRLNLKPHSESVTSGKEFVTPTTGGITPAELFPRLDIETPTTADIPCDGPFTAELLETQVDKGFLSADGFHFSTLLEDDEGASGDAIEIQTLDSNESSPSKDALRTNEFDPFGLQDMKRFSREFIDCEIKGYKDTFCYTHPADIMREVQKRPYTNIFASQFDDKDEDEAKISCNNIATLTACLQRSVMLPLSYQLEVVNNSILTYFLINLDMYEHLRSLKDYFFLMDGEFSKSICHNLFANLVKTINPQELLNFATLHNILDKALGSSISHVHKFSENLSFTITEPPLSFQHTSPDVLQCLSLTYLVNWPLNIIVSQEALIRYGKVFQFLVKMRRVSWVLGQDFETLKLSVKLSRRNSRKLLHSPQYTSIQAYRHIMASLIRALDNYIVTTCILVSWTEFESDLKKARTLDDLYDCHVVYIKKVLFRCLLNNRSTPVMKLLNDIFTVILKFSRVLKAGEWQQKRHSEYFTHPNFTQLEELFHLFEKLTKYLHKVITRLMECGYQRHLVELLTMVNLNGYYDPDYTCSISPSN